MDIGDDKTLIAALLGTGWAGQFLFNFWANRKKEKAETQALTSEATAKTSIIDVMQKRIDSSEATLSLVQARMADLEARLNTEHELRLQAKEENALLRIRVRQLEFALAQAGIPLPTDLLSDYNQSK